LRSTLLLLLLRPPRPAVLLLSQLPALPLRLYLLRLD
jgi:hypothetical protein